MGSGKKGSGDTPLVSCSAVANFFATAIIADKLVNKINNVSYTLAGRQLLAIILN